MTAEFPTSVVEPFNLRLGWFHRYPARFAPEVVSTMLATVQSRLGRLPNRVLDPFMGSGTTLAACRQSQVESVGIELFPLGVLIAGLRLDPPNDLDAAIARADVLSGIVPRAAGDVSSELVAWMGADNARRVARYVAGLAFESDVKVKRFLMVAISAALRPSSKWLAGSIKAQTDPTRLPPNMGKQFRRAARHIAKDCLLESSNKNVAATPIVASATHLPFGNAQFDALITSPPYWKSYDYVATQRLTYWAFRWAVPLEEQIGREYGISPDGAGFAMPPKLTDWYLNYGSERYGTGRALREYIQRMRLHLAEAFRVLTAGGVASFAVANSLRSSRIFDLVGAFCELAEEAGFTDIEAVGRPVSGRRILPAGRDAVTGKFSSLETPGIDERLIFMRRP